MSLLVIAEPKNVESLVTTWTPAYSKPVPRRSLHPGTGKWVTRSFWFPKPNETSHGDLERVRRALEKMKPYSEEFLLGGRDRDGGRGFTGVAVAWRHDEDGCWEYPLYRLSPEALRREFGQADPRLAPWLAPNGLRGLAAYLFFDDD